VIDLSNNHIVQSRVNLFKKERPTRYRLVVPLEPFEMVNERCARTIGKWLVGSTDGKEGMERISIMRGIAFHLVSGFFLLKYQFLEL
jgi:hypothetical protein